MSGQNNRSVLVSGLSLVASGACAEGKRLFLVCAGIKGASRLGEAELVDLITACVTLTEMPCLDLMVKAAARGYLAWLMEYKLLAGTALAPEVQAALLPLLKDERWDVRYATAQALAGTALAPEVQAALLPLLKDARKEVRRAAAAALKPHADNPLIQAALAEALAQMQTE